MKTIAELEMIAATGAAIAAQKNGTKPDWERIQNALCEIPNHAAAKREGTANEVTWLAELVFNAITSKALLSRAQLWASIRAITAEIAAK